MNEARSWRVALIFGLVVTVIVLLIDRAGMGKEIEASERRAAELQERERVLDVEVNEWRTSAEGARDSLQTLKDELKRKRPPSERARDIARSAYGLPVDSLVRLLESDPPDYR